MRICPNCNAPELVKVSIVASGNEAMPDYYPGDEIMVVDFCIACQATQEREQSS